MTPKARKRIAESVPVAARAMSRHLEAEGGLVGRRPVTGKAAIERAMKILGPAIRGEVPVDETHGKMAALVLSDAHRRMRAKTGG